MRASLNRMWAVALRHHYLITNSWLRSIDLFYWPIVDLLLWGLLVSYLQKQNGFPVQAAGFMISAMLLWQVLVRSKFGVSVSFFEEMWSRNLGHLFVAPIRPAELIGGLILVAVLRSSIGVGATALLAWPLFDYPLGRMLPVLLSYWWLLAAFGWVVGTLVAALVLRYGQSAEYLGWYAVFILAPISGIYYPLETLPAWIQPLSLALPSTHAFEGMRAALAGGGLDPRHVLPALGLDILYLGGAIWLFDRAHKGAKDHAMLIQMGE